MMDLAGWAEVGLGRGGLGAANSAVHAAVCTQCLWVCSWGEVEARWCHHLE